jgi:hypothetical protein
MKFAKETWLLALICTLDMLSTAWLLGMHLAREANPIMRFYVDQGILTFIAVKTLLFFAPLYVLELLRRYRPLFIRKLILVGIAAYVLVYCVGVAAVNSRSDAAGTQVAAPGGDDRMSRQLKTAGAVAD